MEDEELGRSVDPSMWTCSSATPAAPVGAPAFEPIATSAPAEESPRRVSPRRERPANRTSAETSVEMCVSDADVRAEMPGGPTEAPTWSEVIGEHDAERGGACVGTHGPGARFETSDGMHASSEILDRYSTTLTEGVYADASVGSVDLDVNSSDGNISADAESGSAGIYTSIESPDGSDLHMRGEASGPSAHMSRRIDEHGIDIGASASLGGVNLALDTGARPDRDDDEFLTLGFSEGPGLGARTHWGDRDGDGVRELGLGFDVGPVSLDYGSEPDGAIWGPLIDMFIGRDDAEVDAAP